TSWWSWAAPGVGAVEVVQHGCGYVGRDAEVFGEDRGRDGFFAALPVSEDGHACALEEFVRDRGDGLDRGCLVARDFRCHGSDRLVDRLVRSDDVIAADLAS